MNSTASRVSPGGLGLRARMNALSNPISSSRSSSIQRRSVCLWSVISSHLSFVGAHRAGYGVVHGSAAGAGGAESTALATSSQRTNATSPSSLANSMSWPIPRTREGRPLRSG